MTAAWGDDLLEDDDGDEHLDGEDDIDIGLINALEAVDLADAYRGSGLDEVDGFDYI